MERPLSERLQEYYDDYYHNFYTRQLLKDLMLYIKKHETSPVLSDSACAYCENGVDGGLNGCSGFDTCREDSRFVGRKLYPVKDDDKGKL